MSKTRRHSAWYVILGALFLAVGVKDVFAPHFFMPRGSSPKDKFVIASEFLLALFFLILPWLPGKRKSA